MWQFCSDRGKSVRRMELNFEVGRLSKESTSGDGSERITKKDLSLGVMLKQAEGTYGRE
jgi:hypothetical protein